MILILQQAGTISIKGIYIDIYTVQLCTKEMKKIGHHNRERVFVYLICICSMAAVLFFLLTSSVESYITLYTSHYIGALV